MNEMTPPTLPDTCSAIVCPSTEQNCFECPHHDPNFSMAAYAESVRKRNNFSGLPGMESATTQRTRSNPDE